ncbi:MAG: hypothetical protein ABH950_08855 [Candidatus Altiarchaeota archaeon]
MGGFSAEVSLEWSRTSRGGKNPPAESRRLALDLKNPKHRYGVSTFMQLWGTHWVPEQDTPQVFVTEPSEEGGNAWFQELTDLADTSKEINGFFFHLARALIPGARLESSLVPGEKRTAEEATFKRLTDDVKNRFGLETMNTDDIGAKGEK